MGPAFSRKYAALLVTGTTAIRIPIIKRNVMDFAVAADWTPAAGDVKIAIDATAPANVTNLPTAVASGNGAYWEFVLTAAELTGKQMIVTVVDAATKVVEDQAFLVETFGHASAMYAADLSLANLPANLVQIAGAAVDTTVAQLGVDARKWAGTATTLTSGLPDVNMKTITAGIIAAASFAANALDAVWSTTARILTAATNITSTGGTTVPQTGDAFARLGAAGAGLTALGDTRIANLDATITSRTKPADTQARVTLVDTLTANGDKTGYALSSAGVQAVWDALTSALSTVGSIGKWIVDKVDVVLSTRLATSGYTAPPTAVQNADAYLDRADAIETGLTPRGAQRLTTTALSGKLSGAATATVTIRNAVADSKARITATVDADGNRSAITTDVT